MQVNPAIDRIASSLEPRLARAFLAAVAEIQASGDLRALAAALKSGNLTAALRALAVGDIPARLARAAAVVNEVFTLAAVSAMAALPAVTVGATIGIGLSFNIQNPLAALAARQSGALLVQRVTEETRAGIRALISRSFSDALPPRKTAPLIRKLVGLTERQAQAVMNARAAWADAGLTGDALDGKVARYGAKLLRQRALNISRTESVGAANRGQLAAWQQAAANGVLQPWRTRRKWHTTAGPRTCDRCMEMDGQTAAFDAPFIAPDGALVMGAPLHPSCRCDQSLIFTSAKRPVA